MTGTAALNGVVVASFAPDTVVKKQYVILTHAGGYSGAFTGVVASGGVAGTLSSDATNTYLNIALDFGARSNLNINQQNVANTLTNFFNTKAFLPRSPRSRRPA